LPQVKIMLISGSTREASGNTAVLRTVRALAPDGVDAVLYEGLAALPAFNPDLDNDALPAQARDLRDQIASAGAVLFCTPEYAGTLPGSLKNLLDWTVGGGEMDGKPVGWVTIAPGGRGRGAEEHLAMVLRYVGAIEVDGACVRLPVPREATAPSALRPDGTIADAGIRDALAQVLAALAGLPAR
jgi:chromate reductase, NAD(P)H dehydrogenase (quinone)